jgi:hypothetical protein
MHHLVTPSPTEMNRPPEKHFRMFDCSIGNAETKSKKAGPLEQSPEVVVEASVAYSLSLCLRCLSVLGVSCPLCLGVLYGSNPLAL